MLFVWLLKLRMRLVKLLVVSIMIIFCSGVVVVIRWWLISVIIFFFIFCWWLMWLKNLFVVLISVWGFIIFVLIVSLIFKVVRSMVWVFWWWLWWWLLRFCVNIINCWLIRKWFLSCFWLFILMCREMVCWVMWLFLFMVVGLFIGFLIVSGCLNSVIILIYWFCFYCCGWILRLNYLMFWLI